MSAGPEHTEPAAPAPPTPPSGPSPAPVGPSMAAFGSSDNCPNCGVTMAPDQRYCLNCGHRRGDPRLPFMDAVVFMESMNAPTGGAGTPPPPPPSERKSSRMNANAALIAGVAVLVLALGVGFLIGRVGHDDGSTQAQAPQIIKVEGGSGGGETAATTPTEETESTSAGNGAAQAKSGSGGKSGGNAAAKKKASEIKEGSEEELRLAQEKTEEVTHAKGKQLKAGTQLGETCEKGAAGCGKSGKFEGEFFGE